MKSYSARSSHTTVRSHAAYRDYNMTSRRYHVNTHYRDKPIVHEIFLTLEELSRGCTKNMKIAAKVFSRDFVVERIEEKIVKVTVPAGAKDGTRVIVPSAGNKKPGLIPGDVIFVIREREHACFTRDEKNNLIYKVEIPLREALTGCNVEIPLPCGESLKLCTGDVVSHGICKRIPGKGMPRGDESRGDLLVEFSVAFPRQLNEVQKSGVRSILSDTS